MPRPVCCECGVEFKVKKNGVIAQENTGSYPNSTPYKIWSADLWECPKCLHQILFGYGLKPMSQHFDEDFKKLQEKVEIFFF
jgi:hypothetical protein